MRKPMIYVCSAMFAMAVTVAQPVTSMAAVTIGAVSGNGQLVIGGSGAQCLETLTGSIRFDCDKLLNWKPSNGSNAGGVQIQVPSQKPEQQPSETPTQPDHSDNSTTQSDWAEQVVELVNAERAKAGLSALKLNRSAAGAAQVRAQEIASVFSHTRPDGSGFQTALDDAGVACRGYGENIAYGQSSPQAVMNQWMNSSGHRANILSADFTEIGVGHYRTANGTDYWVQLFIR